MGTFSFININALIRRLMQEDHLKFKASLDCMVRPYLKEKEEEEEEGKEGRRQFKKKLKSQ